MIQRVVFTHGATLGQVGDDGSGSLLRVLAPLIIIVFAALACFVLMQVVSLYFTALGGGARIPFLDLLAMRLRRVDVRRLVVNHIRAAREGLAISTDAMESHLAAGGNLDRVVMALIAARAGAVPADWAECCAMDLSGKDPFAEIEARARASPSRPA